MKKIIFSIFCVFIFFTQISIAQTETSNQSPENINLVTQTFKVFGNCESCKVRIEKSVSEDGVNSAYWDSETKLITVSFNPEIISLEQINSLIASEGYDTETAHGDTKKYNKLPMCCQYERKSE